MDYSIPIEETKEWALMMAVSEKIKDAVKGSNPALAPTYMRDFCVGLDVTGLLLSRAMADETMAGKKLDLAKSIGYFDFAPEYLDGKGIKHSDAAKTKAAILDPNVQTATEIKAKTEAIVVLLKNKAMVLRCTHDDIKKSAYASEGL